LAIRCACTAICSPTRRRLIWIRIRSRRRALPETSFVNLQVGEPQVRDGRLLGPGRPEITTWHVVKRSSLHDDAKAPLHSYKIFGTFVVTPFPGRERTHSLFYDAQSNGCFAMVLSINRGP
jgi:hypothetical protein